MVVKSSELHGCACSPLIARKESGSDQKPTGRTAEVRRNRRRRNGCVVISHMFRKKAGAKAKQSRADCVPVMFCVFCVFCCCFIVFFFLGLVSTGSGLGDMCSMSFLDKVLF